jgi:hypothetical protein
MANPEAPDAVFTPPGKKDAVAGVSAFTRGKFFSIFW